MASEQIDGLVVGAGVVGLAVGRALARRGAEIVVADAAGAIGTGTSSRNSEVIHAGIYYPTGSLKARLCVAGKHALYRYCADKGIPHRRTGKLIVAVTDDEVPTLERYRVQAAQNGVPDLQWRTAGAMARLEPAVRCVRALFSPSTGIVDSHALMLALQGDLEAAGGQLALHSPVPGARRDGDGFVVALADGAELRCRWLVNAAGLHAPEFAAGIEGLGTQHVPRAFYAKGHYYTLAGSAPFRHLVYPLAGDGGLGVPVTLDLAGGARFGPDVRWIESVDYAFDDGRRADFVAAIRRYYPDLDAARLQPGYTGVRPKIVGPGVPAADFVVQGPAVHGVGGLVNLFGIESPGLTASLALADAVADALYR